MSDIQDTLPEAIIPTQRADDTNATRRPGQVAPTNPGAAAEYSGDLPELDPAILADVEANHSRVVRELQEWEEKVEKQKQIYAQTVEMAQPDLRELETKLAEMRDADRTPDNAEDLIFQGNRLTSPTIPSAALPEVEEVLADSQRIPKTDPITTHDSMGFLDTEFRDTPAPVIIQENSPTYPSAQESDRRTTEPALPPVSPSELPPGLTPEMADELEKAGIDIRSALKDIDPNPQEVDEPAPSSRNISFREALQTAGETPDTPVVPSR